MAVVLGLLQYPLADPAFGVVVAGTKSRVEPALLVGIVQVAVDVKFDAFLYGKFVCADGPVNLCLFAAVEAVDLLSISAGANRIHRSGSHSRRHRRSPSDQL